MITYDNKKTKTSETGGEALLQTTPGAPTGLKEDLNKRSQGVIRLVWDEPKNMGGSKYVTYRIQTKTQTS